MTQKQIGDVLLIVCLAATVIVLVALAARGETTAPHCGDPQWVAMAQACCPAVCPAPVLTCTVFDPPTPPRDFHLVCRPATKGARRIERCHAHFWYVVP